MNRPKQRGNVRWQLRDDHNKVDTSASKGSSSCSDGSPIMHGEIRPENASNYRQKVSKDSAGNEQLSNERHQDRRDLTDRESQVHHDDGHDAFAMVDPSAKKGQGSAGNERPSSAKRRQSPKIPSLQSDSSSLPADVLSFSVRVSEEENLPNTQNHQKGPETPENKTPGGCSSEVPVNPSTPSRLDICKVKSSGTVSLKPSVFAKNREIRKASLQKASEILRPGMVLLKNYISHADQMKIIKVCRDLGLGAGGFYRPCFESGGKMNLQMMCLGMNWDPEKKVYEKRRSVDGAVPPGIPDEFKQIVKRAVTESHALVKEKHRKCNPEDVIPSMQPDICIVNFYARTDNLGLHQDKDESKESLDKGLPVVSISIGDSANFLYGDDGDAGKATKVVLESGDVLIFGGKSRHVFHGITSILPDTAPKALAAEANLRPGRLNLTFREH